MPRLWFFHDWGMQLGFLECELRLGHMSKRRFEGDGSSELWRYESE